MQRIMKENFELARPYLYANHQQPMCENGKINIEETIHSAMAGPMAGPALPFSDVRTRPTKSLGAFAEFPAVLHEFHSTLVLASCPGKGLMASSATKNPTNWIPTAKFISGTYLSSQANSLRPLFYFYVGSAILSSAVATLAGIR
jgi:hypothetical protein